AAHTARGQYAKGWQGSQPVSGYLQEEGTSQDSKTETYAAVRLDIDTRRWAGVPFYLRTGKRLGRRVTEIAVVFKRAPHLPFERTATEELGQNAIVIRVQPDGAVALGRVLTLIIITDDARPEDAIRAANDASREHPCRVIAVIRGNRRGASRLDAQVRIGGDAGASEVIVLRLYGPLVDHGDSC